MQAVTVVITSFFTILVPGQSLWVVRGASLCNRKASEDESGMQNNDLRMPQGQLYGLDVLLKVCSGKAPSHYSFPGRHFLPRNKFCRSGLLFHVHPIGIASLCARLSGGAVLQTEDRMNLPVVISL